MKIMKMKENNVYLDISSLHKQKYINNMASQVILIIILSVI